jgi:WbqC-like protein family
MDDRQSLLLPLFYNPHPILLIPFLQGYPVVFNDREIFSKKTWRSKSTLISSQGLYDLRIPVLSKRKSIPYSEVRIDNSSNWARDHWRFLVSNYGKAPYFVFLQDFLQDLYDRKIEFLFDFNLELLRFSLKVLRISGNTDLLSELKGKEEALLECDSKSLQMEISRVSEVWPGTWPVYSQLFGRNFASGTGILDLVMCQGPDGKSFLNDLSEQMGDFQRFCGKNY